MRILVPAVALLTLATGISPAMPQSTPASNQKPPEQVLKDAGLTRFGPCYVLAAEMQAGKLVQDFNQHAARLSAELQREVSVEENLQYKSMEAGILREKAQVDRNQAHHQRGRGRSRARNDNRQASRLDREARSIQRSASGRERQQLGSLQRAASSDQKQMAQDQSKYQALVQSTMKRYAELAARSEIQSAFRTLNEGTHPKFVLGPVGAYQARVQHAMFKQLAGKGLKLHHGGVAEPFEEKAFIDRANKANVLYLELSRSESPANDPRRATLTKQVADLRSELAGLNHRAEVLAGDPEVVDALQELWFHDRTHHYRVGLGLDAERARHILDTIEKGLASPAHHP